MKLFSGTSNQSLAQKIATIRGITLGDAEITRFIDNECRVFVKEDVEGQDVYIVQSLSQVADQNLVELCLLGSAMKDLGAAKITAIIPWMGYSKQDKAFRKGEAVSAQLVAKFIEAAGFDKVITCELHSENVLPYFSIPVVELSTHMLLASVVKNTGVVVSPDKGGESRSGQFAKEVGLPIVYLSKMRDVASGAVSVIDISESVKDKDCIIFDDIINSGATAIKTSEFLKQQGAGKIYFLATHGVLAGDAAGKLAASAISHVILTDTIVIPKEKMFDRLRVESVADLLAHSL